MTAKTKKPEAEITRSGLLDMQVCVPKTWMDHQIEEFANANNPAGTEAGWTIRRQGSSLLAGADERVPCEERNGCVHLMLDA